ncbi:MAG: hypothetical protein JWM37_209 [Candidatus Saccharibacteria bacterium]|nr:hypothetical protein [Candidatus Saccharibacteria bacterium]
MSSDDMAQPHPFSQAPAPRTIIWNASEFIAHEKSIGWYAILGGGTVVVTALIFLITRDKITAGFIPLAALLFGVAASRKPHEVQYQIDEQGISIGDRFLPFHQFRSFSIVQDGAFSSIVFQPLKRFALLTSAYIDPKDEEAIIDIVSDSLPVEDHAPDLVEQLMRRIRF